MTTRLIDPETHTQGLTPSIAVGPDGSTLIAWVTYASGGEAVVARLFANGLTPVTPVVTLSRKGTPREPHAAFVGTTPVVCWVEEAPESIPASDGERFPRHELRCSALPASRAPGTAPSEAVTVATADTVLAFSIAPADGALWIAVAESVGFERERIVVSRLEVSPSWPFRPLRSSNVVIAERPGLNRPSIAATGTGCVVAYDSYERGSFAVRYAEIRACEQNGSRSLELLRSDVTIAEADDIRQLDPSVAVDEAGRVWAAWLALSDVVDDHGIVDQLPSIRAALLIDGVWRTVEDHGNTDIALLAWGLLTFGTASVYGYLGRRRKPVLIVDGRPGVSLLWERKSTHDGATAKTGGMLCRRRLEPSDGTPRAGSTEVIGRGPRWFAPAVSPADGKRDIRFVARAEPEVSTEHLVVGLLPWAGAPSEPLVEPGSWSDFRPLVVSDLLSPKHREQPPSGNDPESAEPFWADLHVHTGLSADAEGLLDEIVTYARDTARLDVLLLQDNDHYQLSLTDAEYDSMLRAAERYTERGRFVVIPGFEWTLYEGPDRAPNHRTVFGRSSRFPILRNTEAGADRFASLAAHTARSDGFVHIHHERFAIPVDGLDSNLEICSGWNTHMAVDEHRRRYHEVLTSGRRLGFIGGSDNHRRNPGAGGALTGIFTDRLERGAIVDALVAHRCFATAGARIIPRLTVAGGFIGSAVTTGAPPEASITVEDAPAGSVARLYRDGEMVFEAAVTGAQPSSRFVDGDATAGEHFYYLEVLGSEEIRSFPSNLAPAVTAAAWTSPVWVTVT